MIRLELTAAICGTKLTVVSKVYETEVQLEAIHMLSDCQVALV